jgi:acetylornithine/succinyldiaminopimelate/putrescine aminotransferase
MIKNCCAYQCATNSHILLPLNDVDLVEAELKKEMLLCVIIEPIQGVGGLRMTNFFQALEKYVKRMMLF